MPLISSISMVVSSGWLLISILRKGTHGNSCVKCSWLVGGADCSDLWMERCWLMQRNHRCDLLVKLGLLMVWDSSSDLLVEWCCMMK